VVADICPLPPLNQQVRQRLNNRLRLPSSRLLSPSSKPQLQRLPLRRLQPPENRCLWAPSFPPSQRVALPKRSVAWSTITAAVTTITRCFRGITWCT
jgi:hypothetical protein